MIITCEECTTRFQLDDTRVPEQGVRVRCSRCRHAFFVKPDVPSGGDAIEAAVASAVAEEPIETVAAGEPGDGSSAEAPSRAEAGAEGQAEPESDWEFNHDEVAGHDAALAVARDHVDELLDADAVDAAEAAAKRELFGDTDAVDAGLDALLDGPDASPELADPEPDADTDAPDGELDLEPAGVFEAEAEAEVYAVLGSEEADGLALADESGEPGLEIDVEAAGLELGDADAPEVDGLGADVDGVDSDPIADGLEPELETEPELEAEAEPAPEPAADASPAFDSFADLTDEELGSPDDWNFLEEAAEPAAAAGGSQVLGRIAVGPPGSFDAPATAGQLPAVEPAPPVFARWVARAGSATGWVATLALLVFALGAGFGSQAVPTVAAAASGAQLGFRDVRVQRVDNRVGGSLLVVAASLRDAAATGPARRYTVRLLDASGAVLEDDAGSFAAARGTRALREAAPSRLRAEIDAEAIAAGRLRASATGERPVQAVLAAVPADARYFEIVAVPIEAPPAAAAEPEPAAP